MRKTIAIITAALMLLSLVPAAAFAASAPAGIAVSTANDFMTMAADGTYYLAGDIVLMETYETPFTGTLDGNGHKITVAFPAFKEFSGTVKNLTIEGEAELAAFAVKAVGKITVENVTNNAAVTAPIDAGYSGGIVAQVTIGDAAGTASFVNCVNNGNVVGGKRAGGIVGQSFASENEVHGCINNGTVSGAAYVAGIAGQIGQDEAGKSNFHITNCINTGDISCTAVSTSATAGIMGRCGSKAQKLEYVIENCFNSGKITVDSVTTEGDYAIYGGGISGYFYGGSINGLRHCYNTGDVSVKAVLTTSAGAKASYAAGVLAYVNSGTFEFCDCYNTGKIQCSDQRKFEGFRTAWAASLGINVSSAGSGLFNNNWTLEGCCEENEINGGIGDYSQTFTLDELKNGTLCTKINEGCLLREEYSDGAYFYMDGQECVLYDLPGKTAAPEFKVKETEAATTKPEETTKEPVVTTAPENESTTAAGGESTTVAPSSETTAAPKDDGKKGCGGAVGFAAVAAVLPAAFAFGRKKED